MAWRVRHAGREQRFQRARRRKLSTENHYKKPGHIPAGRIPAPKLAIRSGRPSRAAVDHAPRHSSQILAWRNIAIDCSRLGFRADVFACPVLIALAALAYSPGTLRRRHPPGHEHLRSEEHTSELTSLMRISYAVFCL